MRIVWDRRGNGIWRALWWTSISPPYDVYIDGELQGTTSNNYWVFEIDPTGDDPNNVHPPAIEIVAHGEDSDYQTNPNRMYLQWYHQTGAVAYGVFKYVDGEPVWQGSQADHGEGYYSYHSEPLEPGEYRYVVVGVNEHEEQVTVRDKTKLIVSYPDGLEQVEDSQGYYFEPQYVDGRLYFSIENV